MNHPPWHFDYAPVRDGLYGDELATEFIVATRAPVNEPTIEQKLSDLVDEAKVLVMRPPVHWALVRTREPRAADCIERAARSAGLPVRYVASTIQESLRAPERLYLTTSPVAAPGDWRTRSTHRPLGRPGPGLWFLGPEGIGRDAVRFGFGAGTRLAVIDDDAAEIDELDLDAQVLVDVESLPRSGRHGALMVAWAAGTRDAEHAFAGVAPATSVRLYGIAKPGRDALSLPLAILRAADDGADVIVAATYVEGTATPMLDDALEFATRLGRGGRGCAIVMPTGRQTSSAGASVHASFSLGFGDPASDPRVFCIGPSGRQGGWFFWRDRKGKLRPFANRGPAVRWLAPGDDIADPFSATGALCHAESSAASALAAGAMLLLIEANPELTLAELGEAVTRGARPIGPPSVPPPAELADPSDALPAGGDEDGHDAKHGYGRIDIGRACLLASDPIAAALAEIGEWDAARAYLDRARRRNPEEGYSPDFARWAARCLLARSGASEPLKAMVRHLRLLAVEPERARAHAPGAILRHLVVALETIAGPLAPDPSVEVRAERNRLLARAIETSCSEEGRGAFERAIVDLATELWSRGKRSSGVQGVMSPLPSGGERGDPRSVEARAVDLDRSRMR